MKSGNKKQVLDTFSERLCKNFEQYCSEYRQEKDLSNFVTYLIDTELILDNAIKQYTIAETYEELMANYGGHKTQTVEALARRFNLTPRSIWNVLSKHRPQNQKKRNHH